MEKRFPGRINVPILNHLTGRTHVLRSGNDLEKTPATLARIIEICNEPEIYDWLFRRRLEGRPYAKAQAQQFLKLMDEGWASATHFVFVVMDEAGLVVAACDIKSNHPMAEIGYWASRRHRGIMTNAIKAMCGLAAEAGFRQLFARVRLENARSRGVLERAGFVRGISDSDDYVRFELLLDSKR